MVVRGIFVFGIDEGFHNLELLRCVIPSGELEVHISEANPSGRASTQEKYIVGNYYDVC